MSESTATAKKLLDEMGKIEFENASDIRRYATKLRELQRAIAMEVELSADELEAALATVALTSTESMATSRKRAKAVASHLRRAGSRARESAISSVSLWGSVRKHYGILMGAEKPRKSMNMKA
ncbi:hypothetical protein [Nocardiopsis ansamitocini]|uniref:Uncharacterized protein n=1 Tax=Nocardiopsis ansamitocini TaxID=1670832 RepID=A0A9W6UKE0_9ACTN|nr:hypothetical protein [Nocardiopsis ansamitocini]GLU49849.1 hypothetical protein Nans01_42000 [Nocardiopsis ansamitocini]